MGNKPSSKTYEQYYQTLQQQRQYQQRSGNGGGSSGNGGGSGINLDDIDPYEVFGLSKNFEWDELKDSYRRLAKLVHPDKGGTEEIFNKVTECFKYLAHEYKLRKSDRPHYELKKESHNYYESEYGHSSNKSSDSSHPEISKFASTKENLDGMSFNERFNKTFEENKLDDDENSKGYGDIMAKSSKNREDLSVPVYIKPGKKLDMNNFNKTFDTVSLPKSTEIVKYREPEALPLAKKMQYTELGEVVEDFTSSTTTRDTGSLQYTDYMKAYASGRLVDPRSVQERPNYKNVNEYETARERVISRAPTDEELQWIAKKERDEKRAEELRLRRLAEKDRITAEHHDRMNRLLIGGR